MGASGAGKTTIGRALAEALRWQFIEADDLHPAANIAKMRSGVGLTHVDRMPWLSAVRAAIDAVVLRSESAVVACSALTGEYRGILSAGHDDVHFVYLRADAALLAERLGARQGHFAGAAILPSQLMTLEEPGTTALTLDARASVPHLVAEIRTAFHL